MVVEAEPAQTLRKHGKGPRVFTRLTTLQTRDASRSRDARYYPEGEFLPLVATKLTQSPWF
jgi:hypothetical protein